MEAVYLNSFRIALPAAAVLGRGQDLVLRCGRRRGWRPVRGEVVGWSGLAGAVGIHQIYFPVAAPVGTKRGLSAIE